MAGGLADPGNRLLRAIAGPSGADHLPRTTRAGATSLAPVKPARPGSSILLLEPIPSLHCVWPRWYSDGTGKTLLAGRIIHAFLHPLRARADDSGGGGFLGPAAREEERRKVW